MTDAATTQPRRPRRRHAAALSRIAVTGLSASAMFGIIGLLGLRDRPEGAAVPAVADGAAAATGEQPPAPPPVTTVIEVRLRRVPVAPAKARPTRSAQGSAQQQVQRPVTAAQATARRPVAAPPARPAPAPRPAPVTRTHASR